MLEKLPVAMSNSGDLDGSTGPFLLLGNFFSVFQTVDLDKVKDGLSLDQPVTPGVIWLLPIPMCKSKKHLLINFLKTVI